jgi:malate synthase
MIINALNSGAKVFMADFEDSSSPTFANQLDGQINLRDAINGTIEFTSPEGKHYKLNDKPAVLVVRPRGWHLPERHVSGRRRAVSPAHWSISACTFSTTPTRCTSAILARISTCRS